MLLIPGNFYQPRSGMVIGKVELGFLGLGHLGPVLFLGMENLRLGIFYQPLVAWSSRR